MLKGSCKKIFASIATIVLIGNILPVFPSVYTQTLSSYYERTPSQREKALLSARDLVYEYLRNSNEEPAWKDKYPFVSSEKFFYTANDEIPSYIEFKISTSENYDSGFVIVNLDDNDVKIPIASPVGKTPSEALSYRLKNNEGNQSGNKKLYYFSPFDQWIVNEETNNAETLNPHNQEDKIIEKQNNYSTRSVDNNFEKILTEEGKQKQNEKFVEMKEKVKNFVESDEFREEILKSKVHLREYKEPERPSNKFVKGSRTVNCYSQVPCYDQFSTGWFSVCKSGCAATAIMMIMGYYDRQAANGYFENKIGLSQIFPGKAPDILNDKVKEFILGIREKLGTSCWNGSTFASNIDQGFDYFREKGFKIEGYAGMIENSQDLANIISSEIDNSRPVLIYFRFKDRKSESEGGHYVVAFGYSKKNTKIVRFNMGWGNNDKDIKGYESSAIDYHLDSIWYLNRPGTADIYWAPQITETPN